MIRNGIGSIQSPTGFLSWGIYWDGGNANGFLYPGWMGAAQVAQPVGTAQVELFGQLMVGPCRVRNLRAYIAYQVSTQAQTVTVRLGGVDQALTCSIPAGQRAASDLDATHEVILTGAHNLLSVRKTAAAADAANTYGLLVCVEVMPV